MSKINFPHVATNTYITLFIDNESHTVTDDTIRENIKLALDVDFMEYLKKTLKSYCKKNFIRFADLERKEKIQIVRSMINEKLYLDDKTFKNIFQIWHDAYKISDVSKIRESIISDIIKFMNPSSNLDELESKEKMLIENYVVSVVDASGKIKKHFEGTDLVVKDGILYYMNKPLKETKLIKHVIDSIDRGVPANNYINFLKNVADNPREDIKEELFDFLEHGQFPIHEDGTFSAYKKISKDWKDLYTNSIDHSIGSKPKLSWGQVDCDRNRTCSSGLHFCAHEYLSHYGPITECRIVEVRINPKNVAAIPTDYNNMKGRAVTYEVMRELEKDSRIFTEQAKSLQEAWDDDVECEDEE